MNSIVHTHFAAFVLAVASIAPARALHADDWPMLGRDHTRNPVSPEKNPPLDWDVKTGRNIKWRAALGSSCYAAPVVADGLVWIGTNNGEWNEAGAGVERCFRESDGKLLYEHISPQQKGPTSLWAYAGTISSPLVEGNRLWFTTTRAEILCLDIGPLQKGLGIPRELWKLDQLKDLGVIPAHGLMGGGQMCSLCASHGELIYVITANGLGRGPPAWKEMRAPQAPDLVCLNKNTGQVILQDNSPGENTLHGEYGNPVVIEVNGHAQVVAPQGDGWLRSFDALTGELIWKFDINPKSASRMVGNYDSANYFMAAPVWYEGKLYIGSGKYLEYGEGLGRLCCIDPGKRGDISLELADGPRKGRPNPNSGEVWHFDEIGRTYASVAVHKGLVIAACYGGIIYCLDANSGKKLWQHDPKADVRTSPLIVDDKVYVCDEDGDTLVLGLSPEKKVFASIEFPGTLCSSPVFANGVLYIATDSILYAIQEGHTSPPPAKPSTPSKP